MRGKNLFYIMLVYELIPKVLSASTPSFIVSTTEHGVLNDGKEGIDDNNASNMNPEVYEMNVFANVANRFARITITSKVRNLANEARETTFSVILPEQAYISGFVMEKNGKKYDAFVKEKEEAKQLYGRAIDSGIAAAHVVAGARDSNRFVVNVNLEPQSKVVFHLIYEELLQRQNGQYEIVMNIHPGQPVKNLDVLVNINESRPLRFVKSSQMRSGNGIFGYSKDLDPNAVIDLLGPSSAVVKFSPSIERQKLLAHSLGMNATYGLAAQFVVQYDVERDPYGGEVLLRDGHFVHFFAPSNLKVLPKHVIFVLDTSGSMEGRKMEQLKGAMKSILGELREQDLFHIDEFSSNTKIWNLDNTGNSVYYPSYGDDWATRETTEDINTKNFPKAYSASDDYKPKAKQVIDQLNASGGTNIYDALKTALHLAGISKKMQNAPQPMIIFLTDGDPTTGLKDIEEIITKITEINLMNANATIFALSLGDGADKKFLQRLASKNFGFLRHVYEASDSSLQLQDFYRQVSSPLLRNVKFTYTKNATNLTATEFPALYAGSELVVSGALSSGKEFQLPQVNAVGQNGPVDLVAKKVTQPVINLDRFWAYLTVQQLLKEVDVHPENKGELEKKALELTLKYSFVTPVSSLVVVKPNLTNVVDLQAADDKLPEISRSLPLQLPDTTTEEIETTTPIPIISTTTTVVSTIKTPQTTTVPSTTTPRIGKLEELKQNLPWLPNIMKNDDILYTTWGTFKLGINETFESNQYCPSTPTKGAGVCTLLHDCTSVHHLFTNVYIFRQYFCSINNKYAGICCESKNTYEVDSN